MASRLLKMDKLQDASAKQALAGDERWQLVLRISETSPFRRSLRLRTFLLYVCERTLLGREEEIHEAQIGCDVFGKAVDYNPADDNVVRVTARLLRRRLTEYFEGEGRDEPLRVLIPTGRYVPVFEPRTAEAAAVPETPPSEPIAEAVATPKPGRKLPVLQIITAVLAAACILLAVQNMRLQRAVPASAGTLNPLLAAVIEKDRPAKIIVSDSTYSFAQDLIKGHNSLYQYIDAFPRSFLDAPRPGELNETVRQTLRRQYTSVADLNIAIRLIQMAAPYWPNTRVFFARNVTARDLKGANLILIGSRRSNPWVEMFEEPLNFQYQHQDETGSSDFINRAPQSGEPAVFKNDAGRYAHIALVPNIDHNGRVLILEGGNNAGTEAAGEFVTSDKQVAALLSRVKAGPNLAPLEALISLNSIAGMPRESAVVACRPQARLP